jgi:hypothetical protein
MVVASISSKTRATRRQALLLGMAAAVTLLIAGVAIAATQSNSSEAERLRTIETSRLQALVAADTSTARNLIAPDFQLINPGGSALGRDDYLDAIGAGAIDYLAFEPTSPIEVKLSGDSAALRYQASFDLVVGDTRVTHQGWVTDLYERRHGRWQIVWEQATAIPNNFDLFVDSIKPAS